MRDAWLQAVSRAFPDGQTLPGYPLLGSEQPAAVTGPSHVWELRLSLCEVFPTDQMRALCEDVQQLRLTDERLLADLGPAGGWPSCSLLDHGEGPDGCRLIARERAELEGLPGERLTWSRGDETWTEHAIEADRRLLRNLALLRLLPARYPEVHRWAVRSSFSADEQADGLIGDTLAYWTGAVGGAHVLEVQQQPGEGFETLWARLNIPRLLRWEAELGEPDDVTAGAGFFSEVASGLLASRG